jgi:regulatory protein
VNELRQRAIRWLARREHSRQELARKLADHGTREEIDAMLAQLEREGLLSDARYAEAYLRSHGERFGAARLRRVLREKGIAAEVAAAPLTELADELERARVVWSKKFGEPPRDAREWARQARFLQGRGFAPELIRRLLREAPE